MQKPTSKAAFRLLSRQSNRMTMPKYAIWMLSVMLLLTLQLGAQDLRSSGVAQLHGPFWLTEGPSELAAVAELNGDGRLDLILRTRSNSLFPNRMKSVLSNVHGGYAQEIFNLELPAGTRHLCAADVTGDGIADLVVETDAGNPTHGRAILMAPLAGTGVAGATFSLVTTINGPSDFLELADREGDGDADLLVVSTDASGQTSLQWFVAANGLLTAQPAVPLPALVRTAITLADLDGDSMTDVAFLTPNTIERWSWNPAGFLALTPISHGLPSANSPTAVVAVFDLDQDGDEDYIVSDDAATGFQVILDDPSGFLFSQPPPTARSTSSGIVRTLVGIGDCDCDGKVEIVFHERASGASSSDYGSLEFFAEAETLNPTIVLSLPFAPAGGFSLSTWKPRHVCDVDGDGWMDVVGDAGIVFGIGAGRPPVQTLATKGDLVDVDDDGDLDLVAPTVVQRNDGSGWFEPLVDALDRLPAQPPAGIAAIDYVLDDGWAQDDIDGDGLQDLVCSADVTPIAGIPYRETRFLRGRVDGRLEDMGPAANGLTVGGLSGERIPTGDADGDGDVDLFVPGVVWLNDGVQNFSADTISISGFRVLETVQLDTDPEVELLARILPEGSLGVFLLEPQAGGPPASFMINPHLTGSERFADMDGDGDLDLIIQDYFLTQARIYENTGGTLSPEWGSLPGVFSLGDIDVGDLDNDGTVEFIIGDRLYRNATPGDVTGFYFDSRVGYTVEELGDVDCDGDLDLVGGIVQLNRTISGSHLGRARQYGEGTPGSGGYRPILGVSGPLRPNVGTTSLRVSNCIGNAAMTLFVGTAPTFTQDYVLPGLTSYVDNTSILIAYAFGLEGMPNAAGEGRAEIPFAILPAWYGASFFLQGAHFDPGAASLYAVTNGLQVTFGN